MNVSHAVRQENGAWSDTASLAYGMRHTRAPREVYFRSASGPLGATSDHLVPLALLMTMASGGAMKVEGSVSPRLMANMPQVQTLLRAFLRSVKQEFPEIEIEADRVEAHDWPAGRGVACFFSGGVDSTYSALRHRDELDALIFIHGYDLDVRDEAWRMMAAERVRQSAAAIGLPLIELDTNMSRFIGRASGWPVAYGTALATAALLLQPMFRKIYFAGGRAYTRLMASGSHPMLDPLWSTEGMEVAHSGAEAERWQKIKYLADNEIAQKHLRICFERASAPYNCGECSKCLMTMAVLAALGKLDKFQTFAKPLSLEALSRLNASRMATRIRIEDTLMILDSPGVRPFPELKRALILSLERWVGSLASGTASAPAGVGEG